MTKKEIASKYIKRFIGSKRAWTWLINISLKIAFIVYKFYTKKPLTENDLIFLGGLEISNLIVLGLIEIEDIKLHYIK